MPKMKNVTEAELSALSERAFEFMQEVGDLSDRMGKSYADENLQELIGRATTFMAISRECAQMSIVLIGRARLDEQRREIEELHRKRAAV